MRRSKIFLFLILFLAIAVGGTYLRLSDKYVVPIMVYHSINYPRAGGMVSVAPENFRRHVSYLKKHKYKVISLDELVAAIREKKPISKRSVVITFDDGYEDNYVSAFPVLREYGFQATIFVIADVIGDKGYVTWEQLQEMKKYGVTTGSHTLDHVYLPGVPAEIFQYQIKESKKLIEEKLGSTINYIAYPSGGFTEEVKNVVKGAGYKGACTTNRGAHTLNDDVYELKRIRFTNKESNSSLWIKLSGYYNLFRKPADPS